MARSLSIIIPAFNEEQRLPLTLSSIEKFFAMSAPDLHQRLTLKELIVVDDGSSDRTEELALSWKDRLPIRTIRFAKNRGKGAAVRAGMKSASADFLLFYDADGATPITELPKFFARLDDAPIIIGSRVHGDAAGMVNMSLLRRVVGRTYHALCSALVPGLRDTACGCKLFRKDVAEKLFSLQTIDRFAFDVEILALAHRLGFKVLEIPVRWYGVPESKVRVIRDGLQMFWCVIKLYFRPVVTK